LNVTIIGSGNLAWHFAQALQNVGHKIIQIIARNETTGTQLAACFNVPFSSSLHILPESELVLLCVSDSAIVKMSESIYLYENQIIAHTSGSVPMSVLNKHKHHAVIYPLQTFTKNKPLEFKKIPILTEAGNENTYLKIKVFAESLSETVIQRNSTERAYIHLSAVFASNFTNFMLGSAYEILNSQQTPVSILQPIIKETLAKAFYLNPKEAQTGPARRNDTSVMHTHAELLNNFPEQKELYNFVSQKIIQKYHNTMDNFKSKLKDIKAFAFDVDGVFSDLITLDTSGELLRSMNVKDGYSVSEAVKAGYKIAIITGGDSESVRKRFERLGVTDIYLSSKSKMSDLTDFCNRNDFNLSDILYMGDDIPDYEAMRRVGLATCPADAAPEIISISHYISDKRGSQGCIRDVIEQVMRMQGKWFQP